MSKETWVSDCDYCGEITVVKEHFGGKGCESCIACDECPSHYPYDCEPDCKYIDGPY